MDETDEAFSRLETQNPAGLLVVPAVVDLQEDPLGPAVELGVGGGDPVAERHAIFAVGI